MAGKATLADEIEALLHLLQQPTLEVSVIERMKSDQALLRAWHVVNRSRRVVAQTYWKRAAASVIVDDAKIRWLEEALQRHAVSLN
jgi:hypothetical protein